MVTRQIRLNTREQILRELKESIDKKINIVLSDRTVLYGRLKSINDTRLIFANMRLEPCTILLKDITEVYLDVKK